MVIPPSKMTKAQWDHARRKGCFIEARVSKGAREIKITRVSWSESGRGGGPKRPELRPVDQL